MFQKLVGPSFSHANPDVRLASIECAVTFFRIVGPDLRNEIQTIGDLKQAMKAQILSRLDQVDIDNGVVPESSKPK